MATRRTTMRSRTGTKLYAVRDGSGKFKDIQSYKKAHAADVRRTSKAEASAKEKLMAVEKKVERAAKKAAKSVRASLSEAMTAVQRAARKVAKRMSAGKPAARTAAKKAAARWPAKRAAKAAKTV